MKLPNCILVATCRQSLCSKVRCLNCREDHLDVERSTMLLDNPAYATTNQYHKSESLQRFTMLMNNPAYTTFKKPRPKPKPKPKPRAAVEMANNPAYNMVVEYNPNFFSANRLVFLDCHE